MGTASVLIGGLIMIFAPIILYMSDDASDFSFLVIWGFFLISTRFAGGGQSETDSNTFEGNWIEDGGVYESFFGNALFGITILVLIIVAVVFALTQGDSPLAGWLLIAAGALLLIFRFIELNDNDTFFYDSEGGITSLEIPLGAIVGLIAGFINLRSS